MKYRLALLWIPILLAACASQGASGAVPSNSKPTGESTGAVLSAKAVFMPTRTIQPTEAMVPTPTPSPTWEPEIITDASGVSMALVPAGKFSMGNDGKEIDENPVHEIFLDEFYMDVYEVTNEHFAECVDDGICNPPPSSGSFTREAYYGNPEFANYPVIYISWEQAALYCNWRGARLPTEAEWEKAARGGIESAFFPWGDELPICQAGAKNGAKFDDIFDCNDTDTEEVGTYFPNGYGIYDMAGNVWEWVADWYGKIYYYESPDKNPVGPTPGTYRVLRGGSWHGYRECRIFCVNKHLV